jgi:hypothetical protein
VFFFVSFSYVPRGLQARGRWLSSSAVPVESAVTAPYSMIPKKPAPHLMRGGYRFSEKIMLKQ